MLMQLEIKNFAIIEHTMINFENGLNVLTGETGAGKSIILDSLVAVLGGRVNKEMIRKDTDNSYIKSVFKKNKKLEDKLNELNINNEDDVLIVERIINKSGRTLTKINSSIQTLQTLKELSPYLIEICGQKDQQELLKENYYIDLIDNFSNEEHKNNIVLYKEKYDQYKNLKEKLTNLTDGEREKERLIDLYKYQKKEIEEAKLNENEEEELNNQISSLTSFEKISDLVISSLKELEYVDNIFIAFKKIEEASKFDKKFEEYSERIEKAYYELDDIRSEVNDYYEEMEYDPQRLNELIKRQEVYKKIKKKYGDNISDINNFLEEITEKLNEIENKDEIIEETKLKLEKTKKEMNELATKITVERKSIAKSSETKINEEIHQLCMPDSDISFVFEESEKFTSSGKDKIQLYFTANKGEDSKLITKIASGGELSRILLAITLGTKIDKEKVYFFDEIDEGVGGEAGRVIGEKLFELGKKVQVMVISHLPQVAAKGNEHYLIKKTTDELRTNSKVKKLNDEERINEIARMIYGEHADGITIKQAKEMLKK